MFSVIVPVYNNASNIPPLLAALQQLDCEIEGALEVVFVVDGSPDDSHRILQERLPHCPFPSQLIQLSRNYGALAAVRAGLASARGEIMGVMAADLQEPPELMVEFQKRLTVDGYDVAVGVRRERYDSASTKVLSGVFWGLYRRFVIPEIPPGGVDIFGCTRQVRDELVKLPENHSSLIGLLFWIGFRRAEVPYVRRARELGVSGWTFVKKVKYLLDSVFSFSELPIRLLTRVGLIGLSVSFAGGLIVVFAKVTGRIPVPGYSALLTTIVFFGGLNCFGLGIIGEYVWRAFENTKQRPNYLILTHQHLGTDQAPRNEGPLDTEMSDCRHASTESS